MARRYFLDALPPPGPATLRGDVVHHLMHVLRAEPGDMVILGDGRGQECRARIERHKKDELWVVAEAATTLPPPALRIHVAFAPPRFARAEWLFEHGTEVGIAV